MKKTIEKIKVIPYRIYSISLIKIQRLRKNSILKKIQQKSNNGEQLSIFFLVENSAIWKLDNLYNLFSKDERFNTYIVVVPTAVFDEETRNKEIENTYMHFKKNNYKVLKGYDPITKKYLDMKNDVSPDIIFYARPYRGGVDSKFDISKFLDKLNCFVNYGSDVELIANRQISRSLITNASWSYFLESEYHKELYSKLALVDGDNAVIVGYPPGDKLIFDAPVKTSKLWKISDKKIKRIIWAPHHTIDEEDVLNFSNFIEYSELMLEVAKKYKDSIVISFKPHPSLRIKLYNHKDWGKRRTDEYYEKWNEGYNTQLDVGAYEELFNTSSALIHDSVSFLSEYLYVGKPTMFLDKPLNRDVLNDFGKQTLNLHYIAKNKNDIIEFIDDVVLNANDLLFDKRKTFYNQVLNNHDIGKGISGKSASERIYNYILGELNL